MNTSEAMTKPRLTKLEAEIMRHRLGVPDAIISVLEENGHDADAVAEVIEALQRDDWEFAEAVDHDVMAAVLEDLVDGSTYLGTAIKGNESDQRIAAIQRAGDSLARKISDTIGRTVRYPSS